MKRQGFVGGEGVKTGTLGDFVQFAYGKGLPARDRKQGTIPVYGSAGIVDYHNMALVRGPGVVVGRKCTIGEVHWASQDFYPIDTTYYIAIQRKDIRMRYIYYLLKSLPLSQMNTDAAVPGLNRSNALRLRATMPLLSTQDRIVGVLSAYDDLIENNRRRVQLLEQGARLLYKEWFVQMRFPGHEQATIKDGIPEGWERRPLGDIVDIKRGKNITKDSVTEGTVPVVAGGLSPAYYHNIANVIGPVITVSASGANAGYVNIYHEDIWVSDCSYISRTSTECLYYLYLLLTSKQKEIFVFQKGVAQPHVYPKDLKRLSLLDPNDSLVRLFEETVMYDFHQVEILQKQSKLLSKARDILLPRLMNGEVV